MGLALDFGLGQDGLVKAGVGLGGTGLEGGAAAGGPVAPAADEYIEDEISAGANPGVGSGTRIDVTWSQDGLRVWDLGIDGSPTAARRQYSVSPAWGIDFGDWTLNFTSAAGSNNNRSHWWSPDGTIYSLCVRVPSTSLAISTFDQSATPFDFTVLGAATGKNWSPPGGTTPGDHVWSDDGLRLWVSSGLGARLDEFAATVPYDMTTVASTPVKSFTPFSENTFGFSNDGTKLYFVSSQLLRSYEMGIPFDIETLSNLVTGPLITAFRVSIPRGLTFRNDNTDIVVAGDQGSRRLAFLRVPTP